MACCKDLHDALSDGDNSDINLIELYNELKHLSTILPTDIELLQSVLKLIYDMKLVDLFSYAWIS